MATAAPFLPPPGTLPASVSPMMPPPVPSLTPQVVDLRPASPHRPPPSALEQAILTQARDRYGLREEVEGAWLAHYEEDTNYAAGKQWSSEVLKQRMHPAGQQRITVTLNRFPRALHAVQNEERQNRPSIQIKPVDNGADAKTALAYQGMIRHIEYSSNAEDAYDTAFSCLTRGGKGYLRLLTDYENEVSFRQVLRVERVSDPRSVFLDPSARRHLDYHTMAWAFVVERQRKSYVTQRYEVSEQQWQGWTRTDGMWVTRDECLVAEYYCREELPVTLVELPGGVVRYVPQLVQSEDETERQRQQELLGLVTSRLARQGVYPLQAGEAPLLQMPQLRTRRSFIPVVWWYKINGAAVLEQTIWPGPDIPIVPVLGEEFDLGEGGTDYQGIVRNGIGAQNQFNYARSLTLETIAQGPKNPWVGAEGVFDGHPEWDMANVVPYSKLEYKPVDRYGQPAGPPIRQVTEPAIQAVTMLAAQTSQDFDDMVGVYPAQWGEASNEKSGVAIQQRRSAGSLGSSHFSLNASRAKRRLGQLLLPVIPAVYQEPGRVVRILGEDMTAESIQLQPGQGKPVLQGQPGVQLPEGITGMYDLTAGTYDVVVEIGPGYATKQDETSAWLTELMQFSPKVADVGAHIVAGTRNFEGRDELVRMLKRLLPPEILDPEDQQKPEDQVLMLQNQMKQAQQQLQQLNGYLEKLEQEGRQVVQENQQLKLKLTNEQGDLTLKAQELQLQERELALKEREQQFEQMVALRKLELEEQHFQQQRADTQALQAQEREDGAETAA